MGNKSKILMIGPDANSKGGISSVIKLYKDYGLHDNNIIYLSSYKNGNIFTKLFAYGLFIVKYLFTLALDKNLRIVHIHTASRGSFLRKAIAFKIAKLFGKKVIFNIHPIWFATFYDSSNKFIQKMILDTLNKSDLIIVLSETIKSKIANICQNKNIKILHNPVIIKDFKIKESATVTILFLGKLCKDKGIYDLINAAKHINSDVEINLYGDGNIEEFERLIIDHNLQKKVKIKGWVSGDKKDEVLKHSDIYILPSYNEGLPMSILEAMACGLPIISTPVGGISEAVEEGVNGFLVQPGDSQAIAEKIDLLASTRPLREQMGQESYKIAKEKFDIKIIIKQLQDIYDEMLR